MTLSPSRRRMLQALAAAPLALALPAGATAPSSRRLLVLVFLYGGNDAYNTWVPFTDPRYYEWRPNIAVARDSVLKVTDRHGFHPSLATLLPAWEAREMAIVQGIGYPGSTQQHFRDIEVAFTAEDGAILTEGWASRALSRRPHPNALADAIALELLDIREGDPMGPFRGDRIGAIQVHHVNELLARKSIAGCVLEANTRGRERAARATRAIEPTILKTRFPTDPLGQAMRAAVDLARADPELPVIHVTLNGLDGDKHHSVDTHWKQLDYHGDALKRLAEALAALRSAMIELGRWDETLVATYDEFGRAPMENEDRGTHHGHASTHFVLGGRVQGGLLGQAPAMPGVHWIGGAAPAIDTRQLWSTVVSKWWDIPAREVFGRDYPLLPLLRT